MQMRLAPLTLLVLLAALTGGCNSDGSPLEFEGIRFEDGRAIACFRSSDAFPFFIGDISLRNDMNAGTDPGPPVYALLPEDDFFDFETGSGATIMQGYDPDGGGGLRNYLLLPENNSEDFGLYLKFEWQFLQGVAQNTDFRNIEWKFYSDVPLTDEENIMYLLGALFFGVDIELKPPSTNLLESTYTILDEVKPGLSAEVAPYILNDPTGVEICHSDGVRAEVPDAESEIRYYGSVNTMLDQTHLDNLDMRFPNGQNSHGWAADADIPVARSPGWYNVSYQTRLANINFTDTTKIFQIAAVYETTGLFTDNFMADSSFPKDFFDNSDKWLNGGWDSSSGLWVDAVDTTTGSPVSCPSGTKMIQYNNSTVWFTPANELDRASVVTGPPTEPALPDFRLTFFKHFGTFGLGADLRFEADTAPIVTLPLAETPIVN